jgi:hypothetical protein
MVEVVPGRTHALALDPMAESLPGFREGAICDAMQTSKQGGRRKKATRQKDTLRNRESNDPETSLRGRYRTRIPDDPYQFCQV